MRSDLADLSVTMRLDTNYVHSVMTMLDRAPADRVLSLIALALLTGFTGALYVGMLIGHVR